MGANELGIVDPEQREKTVRKIVGTIGPRPCLWVAIPLWSEQHNGLLEVIEKSSAPCVFYDTNEELDTLHMARIHDGIHPTNDARRAWAEAVFDYLLTHRKPRAEAPPGCSRLTNPRRRDLRPPWPKRPHRGGRGSVQRDLLLTLFLADFGQEFGEPRFVDVEGLAALDARESNRRQPAAGVFIVPDDARLSAQARLHGKIPPCL